MAKNSQNTRTSLEEFNESLSSIEQKVENNKKIIYYTLGGVVAVLLIAAAFIYGYYLPNKENAKTDISKADMELMTGQDSLATIDYKKAAEYGNEYGNRAKLNAAEQLYAQGKYQEALKYLEDYDAKGNIVGPAALSLKGDCYVNLKQYDKAISAFNDAISKADDNASYAPLFIMKKATVLHEQKKYADEASAYQTIKDKYPNFQSEYGVVIDKYIERANALAGK